jgi:hypothetical protein
MVMRIGKHLHEEELEKTKKEYSEKGYKIIDLKGKSPDAIAFKDGKAICIEVLPAAYNKRKGYYHSNWTYKGKMTVYSNLGFDEIDIRKYKTPIINSHKKVTEKRTLSYKYPPLLRVDI